MGAEVAGTAAAGDHAQAQAAPYRVGTLTYTKAGLFTLFAWLLWADVCFVLMEAVPGLIPLKLKALDAPNWLMAVMLSTIPMLLNATICPWVSFKSDRHRGKRGRRMPFILYTAPFLTLSLIAIGFSDHLASWLHAALAALNLPLSPRVVSLGLIGLFSTLFAFFNMFVGSVFRAFLATASGYATVGVRRGKPYLEARAGTIDVKRIAYTPCKRGA